jgi:prepilin-type N-terminal cleavage/methylation domain-containing protein
MSRRQRGFTLIELMVALVVSSLLVGMILAIFSRMSLAYRGQQQIAGVQQVLSAARSAIELDAKQAGLAVPQGFKVATVPGVVPAVSVINNSNRTGADQIAFFYADTTTQAKVTVVTSAPATVGVDSTTGFAGGDVVVLTRVTTTAVDPNAAEIATYDSCVVQIVAGAVPANTLTFTTAAPWGIAGFTHCTLPLAVGMMVYKFIARGYRIDVNALTLPARAEMGALQLSATGGLFNSAADGWRDIAYGFTDIQTALQVFSDGSVVDSDGDGDPLRNWRAGETQEGLAITNLVAPIQMSISLVARTDRDIEGISTAATPPLVGTSLGDHPSVPLPAADDALKGSRIYRYTTFQLDFRNLGVGR